MVSLNWDQEVERLKRLIKRKEHQHAAPAFKGYMKRNEPAYPADYERDGSAIEGAINGFKITFLVALLFVGGCFAAKHCHGAETASWYGTTGDTTDPWKHTTTANGEHFNENALTAASWKYALGSKVKVINLRNHKYVIVRINDRGPGRHLYRMGRVIDLTRGSFAKIAQLRDGVIPIKTVLMRVRS
jgi:rare lipoprotein A